MLFFLAMVVFGWVCVVIVVVWRRVRFTACCVVMGVRAGFLRCLGIWAFCGNDGVVWEFGRCVGIGALCENEGVMWE